MELLMGHTILVKFSPEVLRIYEPDYLNECKQKLLATLGKDEYFPLEVHIDENVTFYLHDTKHNSMFGGLEEVVYKQLKK
jgi:hypothetical protein